MEPHLRPDPVAPPPRPRRRAARQAIEALQALLVALVFATFVRAFLVQAFRIPSESMEPSLVVGDHLLVNKFVYGPARFAWEERLPRRPIRRGDLVVFRTARDPGQDFIKRCVALPGDQVEMVDKVLRVNDQPVDDSLYAVHSDEHIYPDSPLLEDDLRGRDNFRSSTVPMGHLFCLGDNRDSSQDSRSFGPVPISHVRGRALIVYWSAWRRIGHLVR